MKQTISVLEMVFPVVFMIYIGYLCRAKNVFSKEGLAGIKSVISTIALPVVLFQAFYATEYTLNSLFILIVIFVGCCLSLSAGHLLGRFIPDSKLMPYLLAGYEVGMLGYALFGLLVGSNNLSYMVTVDLGQVLFVYTVFLTLLKSATGHKPSAKAMLIETLKNPAFLGMSTGLLFGVSGLGRLIVSSPAGGVFDSTIAMITAPTAAMILIMVGYELSFRKDMLAPVIKTILMRVVVLGILLVISCAVIFCVVPFDKNLFMALVLLFSLPAPFIIPLYADVESEGVYISTTLSMNTLVTILIFIILSVYALN